MQCLSYLNVNWHKLVHENDSFLHIDLCKDLAMALELYINLLKYCTKPKNNCTYFTVVGTSHRSNFIPLSH